MARLAVLTFGIFKEPAEHPQNQGFHDRNDRNLAAAAQSDGFIARSGYDDEPGSVLWGETVYPRFYVERGDGWTPATLSLWKDPESLAAFAYSGVHAEALSHGHEWFRKGDWPSHVTWWVADDHLPDWREASERHEQLHDQGPSPEAFDLAHPFGPDGAPTKLDRARMAEKTRRNTSRTTAAAYPVGSDDAVDAG